MDYNKIAQDILDNVGGKANVKQVTHCFTRLRFILKDESLAKKDVVEHLEGVISVVVSGGQFQVVCGAKVTKIYDATVAILGDAVAGGSVDEQVPDQKQPLGNLILQKITEIFTPLVPAIAAAGLIKGLLAAFAKGVPYASLCCPRCKHCRGDICIRLIGDSLLVKTLQ